MRTNRRERGEKHGEEAERTKERRQKRVRQRRQKEKEGENRQQGLALRHAGTLASVQALVCVGSVTIYAD